MAPPLLILSLALSPALALYLPLPAPTSTKKSPSSSLLSTLRSTVDQIGKVAPIVSSFSGMIGDGDIRLSSAGWTEWPGNQDQDQDTLYYGEYMNSGPGSGMNARVTWPGYHVMDYDDATSFSVSNFIYGDEWLGSTSFPYDDDI